MWVLVVLLLLAAALGVLGTVLKIALAVAIGIVLALAILIGGAIWYVRRQMRRYAKEIDRQRSAYPTTGQKRPSDPEFPAR